MVSFVIQMGLYRVVGFGFCVAYLVWPTLKLKTNRKSFKGVTNAHSLRTTHNKRAKEVMEYGNAFVYIP